MEITFEMKIVNEGKTEFVKKIKEYRKKGYSVKWETFSVYSTTMPSVKYVIVVSKNDRAL